jgi:hypothetical protein
MALIREFAQTATMAHDDGSGQRIGASIRELAAGGNEAATPWR